MFIIPVPNVLNRRRLIIFLRLPVQERHYLCTPFFLGHAMWEKQDGKDRHMFDYYTCVFVCIYIWHDHTQMCSAISESHSYLWNFADRLSQYGHGPWARQPGFDSWQEQEIFLFSTVFRLASHPPLQWVLGVKWSGREADRLTPSNVAIKNTGAIPQLPHLSIWHGAELIKNTDSFTFFKIL
jgi:hypothetical protein